MGIFNILNTPIVYNFTPTEINFPGDVNNVSQDINFYEAYTENDSVSLNTDSLGTNSPIYLTPIGNPDLNFTPDSFTIDDFNINYGTEASADSIEILDNLSNSLSLPATFSPVLDGTSIAFIIKITNFTSGTTDTTITLDITAEDTNNSILISKTITINITA